MAACAKQSRAAFFLFKITFLLIPEFLPRRDWGGRKPHGRGAWGETPWSPRARLPEAASTLRRVAGGGGHGRLSFPCSYGEHQPFSPRS